MMEHDEAVQFVSDVVDAQKVPADAARHIQDCPICRARLNDYQELGIELRLAVAADAMEAEDERCIVPPQASRFRWMQHWRTRVSIPRPAFAVGVVLIVALSAGLGYVRAQNRKVFHFEVSSPQAGGSDWGANLEIGGKAGYGMSGPKGNVSALFQLLDIQGGVAHLTVRAREFDRGIPQEEQRRSLNALPAREYRYIPGETLEIPVNGWGTLSLKGEVLDRAERFPWENSAIEPSPNQLVLNAPALVKDDRLVFQNAEFSGSATGPNPLVSFYAPGHGRFIFKLHPFDGAVAGSANFGQVRFELGAEKYLLACATPVTGGPQPRQVWVYLDRHYQPGRGEQVSSDLPK